MGQLITKDVLLVGTEKGQILTLQWDLSAVSPSQSYTGPSVCTTPKWESQPLAARLHTVYPTWPPPRIVDNFAFQVIPQHEGMLLLTVPLPFAYDTPTLSSCEGSSVKHLHPPPFFLPYPGVWSHRSHSVRRKTYPSFDFTTGTTFTILLYFLFHSRI